MLWTDSTVVLTWLQSRPSRWKPFVGHRVSEIQELTKITDWNHISTNDNPADLISRGTEPMTLKHSRLWWYGPEWINKEIYEWPVKWSSKETEEIKTEERKCTKEGFAPITLVCQMGAEELHSRYSSWLKLRRIVAFCIRFINNCKKPNDTRTGVLTVKELDEATITLLREAQVNDYSQEIEDIRKNGVVSRGSSLKTLNPFLDEKQLLRVGGRLERSLLEFEQKHPVILPPKHNVTRLILEEMHRKNLHATGQLLLTLVRQRYWITNSRNVIRKIVHKCLTCSRMKALTSTQLTGQLPEPRVTISHPFTNTGVDYGGPFLIKQGLTKSKIKLKCYIALFVCLATKAIHIELVTDLTSQAFIAALRRFTARRGLCTNIYSDNGTTFVGANRELKELLTAAKFKEDLQDYSSQRGTAQYCLTLNVMVEELLDGMVFHVSSTVATTLLPRSSTVFYWVS